MQAAKQLYGEKWTTMSPAEKKRAVIEANHQEVGSDAPPLMIEGPAFPALDFDPEGRGTRLTIHGKPIVVEQHQDVGAEAAHTVQTAKRVWDCAVVLAKFLEQQDLRTPGFLKEKRAVEMGAGTGIVGLAAAHLGAHVTITDVDSVVPALQKNAALNPGVVVNAAALDWMDPEGCAALGRAEVVLGADIVWMMELIAPMVHSMARLCTENTVIYFAYQSRSSSADELLFSSLQQTDIAWEKIPTKELHPDFHSSKIEVFKMYVTSSMHLKSHDGL